jgi:hypothetical protein
MVVVVTEETDLITGQGTGNQAQSVFHHVGGGGDFGHTRDLAVAVRISGLPARQGSRTRKKSCGLLAVSGITNSKIEPSPVMLVTKNQFGVDALVSCWMV